MLRDVTPSSAAYYFSLDDEVTALSSLPTELLFEVAIRSPIRRLRCVVRFDARAVACTRLQRWYRHWKRQGDTDLSVGDRMLVRIRAAAQRQNLQYATAAAPVREGELWKVQLLDGTFVNVPLRHIRRLQGWVDGPGAAKVGLSVTLVSASRARGAAMHATIEATEAMRYDSNAPIAAVAVAAATTAAIAAVAATAASSAVAPLAANDQKHIQEATGLLSAARQMQQAVLHAGGGACTPCMTDWSSATALCADTPPKLVNMASAAAEAADEASAAASAAKAVTVATQAAPLNTVGALITTARTVATTAAAAEQVVTAVSALADEPSPSSSHVAVEAAMGALVEVGGAGLALSSALVGSRHGALTPSAQALDAAQAAAQMLLQSATPNSMHSEGGSSAAQGALKAERRASAAIKLQTALGGKAGRAFAEDKATFMEATEEMARARAVHQRAAREPAAARSSLSSPHSVILDVDPARWPQLSTRLTSLLQGLDGSIVARELALHLDASTDGQTHDAQWVGDACDQIRRQRFAAIRLPPAFAAVYKALLCPSVYPESIGRARESSIAPDAPVKLTETFLALSGIWSTVCECACVSVMREITHNNSSTGPCDQSECDERSARDSIHGLLRVNYNCLAGAHLDNSFVTLTGSGNVTGALEFAVDSQEVTVLPGSETPAQHFVACEQMLHEAVGQQRDDADATLEAHRSVCHSPLLPDPLFILFVGVKLGGAQSPIYRPLSHRVVSRPSHSTDRINLVYFLRQWNPCSQPGMNAGSAPYQASGDLQINVHQKCIVQMVHTAWPVEEPSTVPSAPPAETELAHIPDYSSVEDDGVVQFDWSADGLDTRAL